MEGSAPYIVSPENFSEAIKNGESCFIQFSQMNSSVELAVQRVLHRYLEKFDILYLKDMLNAILKELSNNAIKANAKRLYFKLNNLDINTPADYRQGMETFKEIVYTPGSDFFDRLERAKLVVRVLFKTFERHLQIHVINNIPIIDEEIHKVNARIQKAYKYDDISDAFDDVLDDSEGAGLGLIMALMLCKSAGFPNDGFKIARKGNLTIAIITIPQHIQKKELHTKITDEIIAEIDRIPSFPENIVAIQRLCANPKSSVREIAEHIRRDPGLTANILKLANSAGYITMNKVETIEGAVKIIGLKGINALLIASGVQRIMDSRYKKFEEVWKSSNRSAFYAQKIAMQMKRVRLAELVYLAALLSDLGRIVMLSIRPDLGKRIKELVGIKGIGVSSVLEEMSLGMSHSTLGCKVLEKWNFNKTLISVIEYHHRPYMAPDEIRDLVYIVYLANTLADIEKIGEKPYPIDSEILQYFDLTEESDLILLHQSLSDAYASQTEE
ncbi:MAG TPA: HDOD domain-containing protein [Spirochaetota bacterium]|nr:HDOD domain-containing protein [Spirochaetota bacterium]HNT12931.1 HDOD domain-containing protein [Spirochaetota bacterium]HOS41580.1 HDOD domain-containing protein [Spirochaetota bacterium]HPU87384.1 HDOD domain-containing protein [Spirochaetota bacterium]